MDLTPKQQTSEAIRQAETILVTTGQHPSVDQVAAVIGLTMILRKFGKKVSAVISDTLPQSTQLLDLSSLERNVGGLRDFVLKLDVSKAEVDKLRYEVQDGKLNVYITPYKGGFAPSDVTYDYGESHVSYDLAIVLGVPARARIDRLYEQNQAAFAQIPVVNLDFHRSNENYGAVNLIEPNASSLCEMLVALSESLQGGIIDADIATALLLGIVASTDRFTAAHTTSKSLTVAAQMMAAGARHAAVVRALYRDGRGEQGRGDGRSDQPRGDQSRGGDRNGGERGNGGGDRTSREAGREQRSEAPREAQRPQASQSRPVAAAAPVAEPEQPVANATQPERTQPEATQSEAALVATSDTFLPIIDPSHIELSEPIEVPVANETPASAAGPVPPAPQAALQPATDIPASQGAPDPMFAAGTTEPTASELMATSPATPLPMDLPPMADVATASAPYGVDAPRSSDSL